MLRSSLQALGKPPAFVRLLQKGLLAKRHAATFKDISREIEENVPAALEVLEGGLFDATAVLALPGKYWRRLRTTKRGPSGSSKRSAGGRR
jgi:hypothetical protein